MHKEEEDGSFVKSFERGRRRTNSDKNVVRNSLENKIEW
jgi:hypothetical protein